MVKNRKANNVKAQRGQYKAEIRREQHEEGEIRREGKKYENGEIKYVGTTGDFHVYSDGVNFFVRQREGIAPNDFQDDQFDASMTAEFPKHYDALGLKQTATKEELKKAYRTLAMVHHPDKGGDAEKFKSINAANETLQDDEKRSNYDELLRQMDPNAGQQGNPHYKSSAFEARKRREREAKEAKKRREEEKNLRMKFQDYVNSNDRTKQVKIKKRPLFSKLIIMTGFILLALWLLAMAGIQSSFATVVVIVLEYGYIRFIYQYTIPYSTQVVILLTIWFVQFS